MRPLLRRSTCVRKLHSQNKSLKTNERGPQGRSRARVDARAGPRRGDGDRERRLQSSVVERQFRRFAARRIRMPHAAAGGRARRLLHPHGRGGRGPPAQSVDRRGTPARRARQRAAARRSQPRALARRPQPVSGGAAEQPRRSGAVHALRFPQDRRSARLLSCAVGTRRCARADAVPAMSRRDAVLAEMGLAPVWRLRNKEKKPHDLWIELKQAVPACTACGLHKTRKQTVLGVGDEHADWLLIGEAPGAEEDRLGEPFVGQAGRLLDNMLVALGMKRGENVYIANVLKCRPPGNRTPSPLEVESCRPYLDRQIALIRPTLIVALGKSAATTLLNVDATIASLRGRVHRYQGVPLIVTYHPAYLLRNLPDKAKAWEDLCLARATVRRLQAASDGSVG